jgi:uncharacterized protein
MTSPYVENEVLDLHAWAREALALTVPPKLLCQPECRGLCAVCGANLNETQAEHLHASDPDPRWAKLSELRFE